MDFIDGLKAFVLTAQTGSFTDAAERLGISNRLTSKYVAQLEEKMGARLLQRTTRKVGLTPEGQELLSRAPVLLAEIEDLIDTVSEDKKGVAGQIRISAPVTFGELFINDLLSRFALEYPGISIDLRLDDHHVDLAADGFDLAFRIGTPDMTTLKARKLGVITSVLIASKDYVLEHGAPESPDDLHHHRCIVDTNLRNPNRWAFTKDDKEYVFHPRRNYMVNNARVAKDWALNGHGIATCPSFMLSAEDDRNLAILLPDYTMQTHPICAVYLTGNIIPKKVRLLIDFAVDEFKRSKLV